MAEIVNSSVIGAFTVRPSDYTDNHTSQLDKLQDYDKASGSAGHDRLHFMPAGLFSISLAVMTTATASTSKDSPTFTAPFPFTIWAADIGCESAAGDTGVIDIQVNDSTILDAPEDVKTSAGTCVRVAPEVGKDAVAYGDEIGITQTSGPNGSMIGGMAILWVQRL